MTVLPVTALPVTLITRREIREQLKTDKGRISYLLRTQGIEPTVRFPRALDLYNPGVLDVLRPLVEEGKRIRADAAAGTRIVAECRVRVADIRRKVAAKRDRP